MDDPAQGEETRPDFTTWGGNMFLEAGRLSANQLWFPQKQRSPADPIHIALSIITDH